MRVIVCGSRNWCRPKPIWEALEKIASDHPDAEIIHGDAPGADTLAGHIASALGLKVTAVPADWENLGKSAGVRRNTQMLAFGVDLVLAFRMPGKSNGTDDMVHRAIRAGVPTKAVGSDGRVLVDSSV